MLRDKDGRKEIVIQVIMSIIHQGVIVYHNERCHSFMFTLIVRKYTYHCVNVSR